jgi:hypothetical protein
VANFRVMDNPIPRFRIQYIGSEADPGKPIVELIICVTDADEAIRMASRIPRPPLTQSVRVTDSAGQHVLVQF